MSRPVAIQHPPRRSKCSKCGAQVTRLYTGKAGAILVDRDGNKPTGTIGVLHRCPGRES